MTVDATSQQSNGFKMTRKQVDGELNGCDDPIMIITQVPCENHGKWSHVLSL